MQKAAHTVSGAGRRQLNSIISLPCASVVRTMARAMPLHHRQPVSSRARTWLCQAQGQVHAWLCVAMISFRPLRLPRRAQAASYLVRPNARTLQRLAELRRRTLQGGPPNGFGRSISVCACVRSAQQAVSFCFGLRQGCWADSTVLKLPCSKWRRHQVAVSSWWGGRVTHSRQQNLPADAGAHTARRQVAGSQGDADADVLREGAAAAGIIATFSYSHCSCAN